MNLMWHNLSAKSDLSEPGVGGGGMPMQQHPTYGAVLRRFGRQVRVAEWWQGGGPVARALVVSRPGLTLLSRGPLWSGAAGEAGPLLRDIARFSGLTFATPERAAAGAGLIPVMAPRSEAIWHLPGDRVALRSALDPKWRNKLTKAERENAGLTIRASARADAGWLYAAEGQQRRDRGYRTLPPAFAESWRAAAPKDFRLYEAWVAGERVAGIMILMHRPWASYHIAWSGDEGRRRNAGRLLLWRAACDLQDDGFDALCLGHVDAGAAPGLATFKAGTGAEIRRLGPTVLILPRLIRPRPR